MSGVDHRLEQVYGAKDREALAQIYDQWADDYDAELQSTGYLHYPVMAGLVARYLPRKDSVILDAGVGTGAFGEILSLLGYNNLHGLDMNETMLAKARARKCYASLTKAVLGEPLLITERSCDAIISTGTFTTGHAPSSSIQDLVELLETDGLLMITVGTVVWETDGFAAIFDVLTRDGSVKHVETTPIYRPMPHSKTESGFTTRAHVYRRG